MYESFRFDFKKKTTLNRFLTFLTKYEYVGLMNDKIMRNLLWNFIDNASRNLYIVESTINLVLHYKQKRGVIFFMNYV